MIFSILLIMFFKHPKQVCMSYGEHFMFSLKISGIFALASIQAMIHAVNPDCFIMSTTENMKRIQEMLETAGCRDQASEL
jgi:hypothetical protein